MLRDRHPGCRAARLLRLRLLSLRLLRLQLLRRDRRGGGRNLVVLGRARVVEREELGGRRVVAGTRRRHHEPRLPGGRVALHLHRHRRRSGRAGHARVRPLRPAERGLRVADSRAALAGQPRRALRPGRARHLADTRIRHLTKTRIRCERTARQLTLHRAADRLRPALPRRARRAPALSGRGLIALRVELVAELVGAGHRASSFRVHSAVPSASAARPAIALSPAGTVRT